MLIDLGKVTRETRACTDSTTKFDNPAHTKFVWFQKVISGVTYLCNFQPVGRSYVDSLLCKTDANGTSIKLDCTK